MKLLILILILFLFSSCETFQEIGGFVDLKDCARRKCYYFWQTNEDYKFPSNQ